MQHLSQFLICHQTCIPLSEYTTLISTIIVIMYLKGKWFETLAQMLGKQFLNLSRGQQIEMLASFQIKKTFVNPNGFEENMDGDMSTQYSLPSEKEASVSSLLI